MNILLLDGGKEFGHSHGELNHTLHKKAKEVLTALGHNVKETVIDAGYDVEAEIEKFLWMDAVIWQMPVWWMHEPWTVKKYIEKYLSLDTASFTTVMAVIVLVQLKASVQVVCCKAKNTCFRLLGMRRLKHSPVKATSLKAKMWMLCTCLSTNSTSSSV